MPELFQHVVVTLVALGAAALLVHRIAGFVRPARSAGCASCPTAQASCAPAPPVAATSNHERPLAFIRPASRRKA